MTNPTLSKLPQNRRRQRLSPDEVLGRVLDVRSNALVTQPSGGVPFYADTDGVALNTLVAPQAGAVTAVFDLNFHNKVRFYGKTTVGGASTFDVTISAITQLDDLVIIYGPETAQACDTEFVVETNYRTISVTAQATAVGSTVTLYFGGE